VADVPNILSGALPDPSEFDYRYAAYAWLAYAHIAPGVVYLLLTPLQFWRRFRSRHMRWHRRAGRVGIGAGVVSGVFAIIFGAFWSFGGPLQASASVIFGAYFVVALALAYRAIRQRDVYHHRRWMIRAFAVGVGIGTIRIWVGLFQGFELLSFEDSFGPAFWLSFTLHALAAEVWLRWRPEPDGGAGVIVRTGAAAGRPVPPSR
jgi:hypothetical protein